MKEVPKKPVTIDMAKDAAGTYTLTDSDGDFDNRIAQADLTSQGPSNIETVIKDIRDVYTDQKIYPKRLSSKGFALEQKAKEKIQSLIIAGAQKADSIAELDAYLTDPLITRLLKWYPMSVPNVTFDRMRLAEEVRCFNAEIARVTTREQASELHDKISKRYNVMGMTSGTAMSLQKILAEKAATLPG